jgi:YfiH family protein
MNFISPQWHAPKKVHALVTTRMGGLSKPPYDSLNLGNHVGDDPENVQENRQLLRMHIPSEPLWIRQIHSSAISTPVSRSHGLDSVIEADGIVTKTPQEVLCILTADCLPVLFTAIDGSVIGASHAGWRGLSEGVLENTVKEMLLLSNHLVAADLIAWLGPAIGPDAFEVGEDVYQAFTNSITPIESLDFVPITAKPGKYMANLYSLARSRLRAAGLSQIEGGQMCTYHDKEQFFSYRRNGATGRFASVIWISN